MADKDDSGTLAMSTDVRVISWNYDMQFENSFAELIHDPYYGEKRESGKMLQVIPTGIECHEHYDGIFSIYKLNGTAGTRDNREMLVKSYDPVVYGQTGRLDSGDLRLTLHFYQNVTRGKDEPYLQFSWKTIIVELACLDSLGGSHLSTWWLLATRFHCSIAISIGRCSRYCVRVKSSYKSQETKL